MENLKEIVSKNIVKLRKENNLTQVELAKKINFSDKAVSRWEKGEVLPDIETLQSLSEAFGVSLSSLLENKEGSIRKNFSRPTKQEILSQSFLICEIWVIISVIYAYFNISQGRNVWQLFIWGIPATALALIVQSRKLKNNLTNFIYGTIFVWTLITSLFIHMIQACPWYFFILGVPIQGLLIVRYVFNYKQKNLIHLKKKKQK